LLSPQEATTVKISSIWTCDGGALRHNLLGGVVLGHLSFVLVVLEVLRPACLVRVAIWVLRAHGCLRSSAAVLGAVVISVTAGWRRCSLCGVCYLSSWQKVRRWMRRGPHAEWLGSVGVHCVVTGVCAEASWIGGIDDLVFAFEGDVPMVEGNGRWRTAPKIVQRSTTLSNHDVIRLVRFISKIRRVLKLVFSLIHV
jgi:hypothetical protein